MMSHVAFAAIFALLPGLAAAQTWTGRASYYDYKGRTASGEKPGSLTAAHRTLPFGTRLKVTNLRNNRSTIVIVSDRGPFGGKRIVDISRSAAQSLDFIRAGTTDVKIEIVTAIAERAAEPEMDLTK